MRSVGRAGLLVIVLSAVSNPLLGQDQKTKSPLVSREKEAELRKVYAKELASKEKEAVEKLLKDAIDTKDDPPTQFQLLMFAYQKAIEIFSLSAAFNVSDELGKRYSDLSPTALRARALEEARKKKPKGEHLEELVNGDLEFAVFTMGPGRQDGAGYDDALKAAKNAVSGAKALKSRFLEDKAEALQKYASDLGKDKGDELSQAKFKFFILGDSGEEVLKVLSNGPEAKLKKLAGLQMVGGKSAANCYEFGEVAYEAAGESGRLPFERLKLLNDARSFYDRVSSEAAGAEKTKYERDEKLKKRKAEIEAKLAQYGGGGNSIGIDLLGMIDPGLDKARGDWKREGPSISAGPAAGQHILKIPYAPPAEYDITVTVEMRAGGLEAVVVGLMKESVKFQAVVDDGGPNNPFSGIQSIDGKLIWDNETLAKGKLLKAGKPSTIVCSVRNKGVTLTVDGKKISEYAGPYSKLGDRPPELTVPANHNGLYVGAWESAATFSKILITPVSGGQGRKLR